MKTNQLLLPILLLIIFAFGCSPRQKDVKVLVFSKTAGFRHSSIERGVAAVKKLGIENGFEVEHTEDSRYFTEEKLKKYAAVIWLSTTMNVLDEAEQAQFERYIQAGGGYVGIHAAADTEYDWAWYGELVGGYFNGHPSDPNVRSGELEVIDSTHISTKMLPHRWLRTDEWYNYKNLNPKVHPLLKIDESTYEGGTNGEYHPMAWYHEFDGGRSWYTAGGHTEESYSEELFLQHILGGIQYAIGENQKLDYSKAVSIAIPQENRFQITVLTSNFDEPMEMEILDDGSILFIERKGKIKKYDAKTGEVILVDSIPVYSEFENGLLGLALDPNYTENHWIYLFNSPVGNIAKQHVSRFVYKDGKLDKTSEKVVLEIVNQRETCCHSGGSLEFDIDGNLYISVGDDTNPFDSDGFSPIDERANRSFWDAQRSASNTNDLRGKVLRIKPLADGTYEIPEGNLFPKGTPNTRPEIYVMGCRNPFRISIDDHTKYLYWGDVGPDAGENDENRGARGHDEVNQAQKAGYFGWPLFVGNNKAYFDYDFATKKSAGQFDANKPMNNSPNNTGIQALPPAQKAFIWYPYAESEEFPLTQKGGRNAMAGPVYYYEDYEKAPNRFPKYYDKKLFIYDWMRGWINVVTMDKGGNYQSMEAFMPNEKFHNPMDMIMNKKDGALYILEYGSKWFSQNEDARLLRIDYIEGNRTPNVKLAANKIAGAAPLTVDFSSEGTEDFDRQDLTYEWSFTENKVQSTEKNPVFTFEKPGKYKVNLKVTDEIGAVRTLTITIFVGNELPKIAWQTDGNSTFYFDDNVINYNVNVTDKEDGTLGNGIDESQVIVTMDYLAEGFDKTEIAQGHQMNTKTAEGRKLMDDSDCKACHLMNEKSAGPSYQQIATKYAAEKDKAIAKLAKRVIKGGGGVWGEIPMSAHPQLSTKEAAAIVRYILAVNEKATQFKSKGTYVTNAHLKEKTKGNYVFMASYTDKGGHKMPPTIAQEMLILRNPTIFFSDADEYSEGVSMFELDKKQKAEIGISTQEKIETALGLTNDKYLKFNQIDLTKIQKLQFNIPSPTAYFVGGTLEIRLDAFDGKMIGSAVIKAGNFKPILTNLMPTNGKHDIYFIFKNSEKPTEQVGGAISVTFLR